MGVVVKRYIDFLILLIPTPLVSVLFCSSIIIRSVHYDYLPRFLLGNKGYRHRRCNERN